MKQTFKNIVINETTTIKEAMSNLQLSSKKILCVLNRKKELVGVLNDGDIRRSILKNLSYKTQVKDIMNKKPIVSGVNYSKNSLKKLMAKRNIEAVPILKKKKLLEIISLDEIINKENEKIDVIINAGGYGKRLKPHTLKTPKTLVRVNNKPILNYILTSLINRGFFDFTFILHYKSKQIISYLKLFNKKYNKNLKINFYKEKKPLGTCGGLSLINNKLLSENIIFMNCDVISGVDFNNLYSFHKYNKADITVVTSRKKMTLKYGSIKNVGFDMKSIEEKPEIEFIVNAGIYVLKKSCLKFLKKNKKFDIPELLKILKSKRKKIKIYPTNEYWFDIANTNDLKICQNFFKKK